MSSRLVRIAQYPCELQRAFNCIWTIGTAPYQPGGSTCMLLEDFWVSHAPENPGQGNPCDPPRFSDASPDVKAPEKATKRPLSHLEIVSDQSTISFPGFPELARLPSWTNHSDALAKSFSLILDLPRYPQRKQVLSE